MSTYPDQQVVPELLAHVPVDRFEISRGPDDTTCKRIRDTVQQQDGGNQSQALYVEVIFMMYTPASKSHFRRSLKVTYLSEPIDGVCSFTAFFSGRMVSGSYDVALRTGWFSAN